MVKLTREQVKELVEAMEVFLAHEATMSVSDLMHKLGIDFEEYRVLSDLCMPAIRRKNEAMSYRVSASQYKGLYNREKLERVKTDEVLQVAYNYLYNRFSRKPVIKTVEQEATENGEDSDPVGNDSESDL